MTAVILSGCQRTLETRRCVDEQGNVLPDISCTSGIRGAGWAYGGRVNGNQLMGYSRTPKANSTVVDSSGKHISRGGFGGGTRSSGFSFGG